MPSRSPNLFLVGAPRCGTTALHAYLRKHPSVFMSPVKELHYYSTDLYQPVPQVRIRNRHEYAGMFRGAVDEPWVGEASPFYLYSAVAGPAIRDQHPDARIVITLRNPVDMMYSMYCLRVRAAIFHEQQEALPSFEQALAAGPARLKGEELPAGAPTEPGRCLYLCYRELGRYADRVERFVDLFGRDRVHVVLFDDLSGRTSAMFAELCRFLGISPAVDVDFRLSATRRAAGAKPRSRTLARLLWQPPRLIVRAARAITTHSARSSLRDAMQRWNDRRPPSVTSETRRRLLAECAPDLVRLGEVLGRDLRPWIRDEPLAPSLD